MRSPRPVVVGVVWAVTASILVVAAWLNPDPAGVGTHRQMGLPACGLLVEFGIPCATCGMTTAFSLAAHGRLVDALRVQPAGAVLAVITSAVMMVSAYGLLTGAALEPLIAWLWRPWLVWTVGGMVIGSWLYKMVCMTWV